MGKCATAQHQQQRQQGYQPATKRWLTTVLNSSEGLSYSRKLELPILAKATSNHLTAVPNFLQRIMLLSRRAVAISVPAWHVFTLQKCYRKLSQIPQFLA